MPPELAEAEELDAEILDEELSEGEAPEIEDDVSPTTFAEVATTMGWKPKDKFSPKREGDKWLPAKEFVADFNARQRNTMRSNRELKGKLDRLEPLVTQLQQKMTGGERATLRAKAREHMEAGEYDKAEELFDKASAPEADPGEHPALADFKARNDWYGVDDDATDYVAFIDGKFAREAGGVKDAAAHMRKVEAAVKKQFPQLFGEKKIEETTTRRSPLVARGGNTDRPRQNGKVTVADLTPAQRRAAESMNVKLADYVENLNILNGAA